MSEITETHIEVEFRAFGQGLGAAQFDMVYGTEETPEQMAMRRKQGERNPGIWSDAFIKGYRSHTNQIDLPS